MSETHKSRLPLGGKDVAKRQDEGGESNRLWIETGSGFAPVGAHSEDALRTGEDAPSALM